MIYVSSPLSSCSFAIPPFCPSPYVLWSAAGNSPHVSAALFTLPGIYLLIKRGPTALTRLALNPSPFPKQRGLQAHATMPFVIVTNYVRVGASLLKVWRIVLEASEAVYLKMASAPPLQHHRGSPSERRQCEGTKPRGAGCS